MIYLNYTYYWVFVAQFQPPAAPKR